MTAATRAAATSVPAAATKSKLQASTQPAASTKASGTVIVACKIPTGLVLQLCREVEVAEQTPVGVRMMKRFDRFGQRVVLNGTAYPKDPPAGFRAKPMMVGGYALTMGVPASFWDDWVEQNRDTAMVQNDMVRAYSRIPDMKAFALEHETVRSGFEPLTPDNDPRVPKPIDANALTALAPTEDMKARMRQSESDAFDLASP